MIERTKKLTCFALLLSNKFLKILNNASNSIVTASLTNIRNTGMVLMAFCQSFNQVGHALCCENHLLMTQQILMKNNFNFDRNFELMGKRIRNLRI